MEKRGHVRPGLRGCGRVARARSHLRSPTTTSISVEYAPCSTAVLCLEDTSQGSILSQPTAKRCFLLLEITYWQTLRTFKRSLAVFRCGLGGGVRASVPLGGLGHRADREHATFIHAWCGASSELSLHHDGFANAWGAGSGKLAYVHEALRLTQPKPA
ncbi:hypothetical protein MIND_00648700 [Mycena indigotica]|uniref:Uncharacterized protein n=1 Tax=Mycena indigotica TaxID=2126181 RepID=A0A8H6STN7_9AGAR|nr:uncharacterized protein MIND_00648700 [Mycena indigotica]KAF7304167.1 hypothetical protein MIND_00648700 [Mycena indigotica]